MSTLIPAGVLRVAIDDASRIAYAAVLPDETKQSDIAFMSDTGSAYRSRAFCEPFADAALRRVRTRSYTPRTNW